MAEIVHIVRKGETLAAISRKYYGNANLCKQIIEFNKISDPSLILAGDKLVIPPKLWGLTGKQERKGNTLKIYAKAHVATPSSFQLGQPIVIGSYYAAKNLVIDRSGNEVLFLASWRFMGMVPAQQT